MIDRGTAPDGSWESMKNILSFLSLSLLASLILASCGGTQPPGSGSGSSLSSLPAASSSSVSSVQADITVSQPVANETVTSPLTVTGEARGSWYFEASFPIQLLDSSGNVIAQTTAQAQGDWMTTNFVPFTATLTFQTTETSGTLVLSKDNPSGLPQNAASVSIPVSF